MVIEDFFLFINKVVGLFYSTMIFIKELNVNPFRIPPNFVAFKK